MRHSNIDVLFVPTGLKKNRTRMLKPLSVLEMMNHDDTNVYASSILDKYENRPNQLEGMCLADFATNYVNKKADLQVEPEDIKSYTEPVSGIDELEPSTNIIVLKKDLGEMKKRSRPCVMRFHKVSKMKSSEEFYLRVLQLYMPWRNESELKEDNQTYEDKYNEVENEISCNIVKHEPNLDIDYEELHNYDILESDEEEDNNDFSMINPDLLDFDIDADSNPTPNVPIAPTTIDNILLPNDQYYEKCSQLNEGQQSLFNFIMKYAVKCRFAERNNELPPDPFYIFLSGGAGVGKSFLVNVITEYLKRILRYPNQSLDEPSVLVTASTGKAATNINGTTLHSAFHLPVKTGNKFFGYRKPRDEVLHSMRNKYKYLKVVLIDEISMTGEETFDYTDKTLQLIKNNTLPFGGVSVISIGDFLQLPPVQQQAIFMKAKKGTYKALQGGLWQKLFELHELVEIVRQSSDPEFSEMLNRLREGNHKMTVSRKSKH